MSLLCCHAGMWAWNPLQCCHTSTWVCYVVTLVREHEILCNVVTLVCDWWVWYVLLCCHPRTWEWKAVVLSLATLKQAFRRRSRPPWQFTHFSYEFWIFPHILPEMAVTAVHGCASPAIRCLCCHPRQKVRENTKLIRKVGELSWRTRSPTKSLL